MWNSLKMTNGEVQTAVIVIVISAIALYVYIKKKCGSNKYYLPPGPVGLPIFGYIPFLGRKPHKTLCRLRIKYGNILGLYFGNQYTVILNDIDLIREAFSKPDFSGRPAGVFQFTNSYENIVNMSGKMWQEHMRYNKGVLRQLGMGKGQIEEVILNEITLTLEKLRKVKPEEDVEITHLLSNSISNVIYSMICGKRFEIGEPVAEILEKYQIYSMRYYSPSEIHAYIPCLKNLNLLINPLLRGAKKAFRDIENLINCEIEKHEEKDQENLSSDFMDHSLLEIEKKNGAGNFTKTTLNGTSQMFLLGGSDTTRVTLEWGIMLLAKHLEIQERAYKEVFEVIGTERLIGWADRESLPYINAVIYEIQRKKTIVPLNLLRRTQKDTTVGVFRLRKNTTVIANIWAAHMDPQNWENPKDFNPDRFLINNGKEAKAPPCLIPFSHGERKCPGEKLATMQLFIILSNLIQNYKFKPPTTGLDFSGELRLVYVPIHPIVQFEKR